MTAVDLAQLALGNLRRTKLRSFLTILGVVVGIGALLSMVSFGTGMQKNVTRALEDNDLFTSIFVTRQKIDFDAAVSGDIENAIGSFEKPAPVLNDSVLQSILGIEGVDMAFPEIRFPGKIFSFGQSAKTTIQALPVTMERFRPFNSLLYGTFFRNDTCRGAVLNHHVLRELKIRLSAPGAHTPLSTEDSLRGFRTMHPDSVIGSEIELITTIVDIKKVLQNPLQAVTGTQNLPVRESRLRFRISGILPPESGFESGRFNAGIFLPFHTARSIPRMGFASVWDLLDSTPENAGYGSVYVRVQKMRDVESVAASIRAMGFGTFSIMDQLKEIRQGFLILDSLLGAVGVIALFVAALGIINTMVMSILERTREIGVMKAIGGSEAEIRAIFFIEAGVIGFLGGIFGLGLGWIVTRIANVVGNHLLSAQGVPHVRFFHFPPWLLLGALAFSVCVSLLAGLYPASRAARVDPVKALRHD